MGHTVTHSNTLGFDLKQLFSLLMRMIVSISTVAAASAALFWVGFHVIPVFADKAPQIFSEQEVQSQILLSQPEGILIPTKQPQTVEKKTLP